MPNDSAAERLPQQDAVLAELLAFERLLAELITTFIDLPADRLEQGIELALRRLLGFLAFDRCGFAEVAADGSLHMLSSVAMDGVDPMPLGRFPEQMEWYVRTIRAGQMIVMHNLPDDLPPEAIGERIYVERSGIRSHVSIPLRVGGKVFGAIGFAAFRSARAWHPELIARLKMVGEVLAVACARARAAAELQHAESQAHQLRAELWRADRAASAGALTGSIAHELNQPLTAILSNAQAGLRFLGRGAADPGEIRDILEAIVREDKRASVIIRGLRAMLRREGTPRASIDLGDAFGEVLALMRGELDEHQVQLETRFDPGCIVLADKTQIQQVAVNLIKNALEAMQPQPRVARRLCVTIRRTGERDVVVAVRDSGIGIAADKLGSVFQPFCTTKEQGMGLGLSITQTIVEAHGGEIGVKSNEDCGVTFELRLQVASSLGESDVDSPPPRDAGVETATGSTVWVVDDDPAVREGLERLLASAGFAVETFASPLDLLRQPTAPEAACMLLDVRLPEMSGPELYARLGDVGVCVPVVFMTGHGDVPTAIEAIKQGAVDYLLKPFDDGVLLDAVRRAVQRHAAERMRRREKRGITMRFERLSPRERDVMQCVILGRLNKQIAAELGISEKTVKQHRGRVMEKLEVRSVVELVRLSEQLDAGRAAGGLPEAR